LFGKKYVFVSPFILLIKDESVEKLFSERNFQISSEKNEEEEGILGLKSAAD
jgi:hypothetical protein